MRLYSSAASFCPSDRRLALYDLMYSARFAFANGIGLPHKKPRVYAEIHGSRLGFTPTRQLKSPDRGEICGRVPKASNRIYPGSTAGEWAAAPLFP